MQLKKKRTVTEQNNEQLVPNRAKAERESDYELIQVTAGIWKVKTK